MTFERILNDHDCAKSFHFLESMTIIRLPFQEPVHWHFLSEIDKEGYHELRNRFQEDVGKVRKGERLDSFADCLQRLRHYIESDPDDSWKRSLVCGIFFLSRALALNIQQLRILLGKCKSSINGSLQQLGYNARPAGQLPDQELLDRLPPTFHDVGFLKKWSFRFKNWTVRPEPRQPFVIPLPIMAQPRMNVDSEAIQAQFMRKIPCPVKWRYKFWDSIHCSVSSQTDA
jgi:hypothetical protein